MSVGSRRLVRLTEKLCSNAKFKPAAASLIRAAMVQDFDTAELIISQGLGIVA